MSPATAEILEQFTFAGAMPTRILIGLGAALLITSALLLWREMGRTRPVLAPLLWLLRGGAIAVVIWMLAGPSLLTRVRHMQPKSVALLVDRSGSMSVRDSGDDLEHDPMELRWLLQATRIESPATTHLDAAAATVRLAASLAQRTPPAPATNRPRQKRQLATHLTRILEAAGSELDHAARADARIASGVRSDLDELARLTGHLKESLPTPSENPDRTTAGKQLQALADKITRLADESAAASLKSLSPADRDRLRAQASHPRSQAAAAWLQEGQARWLDAIGKQARILSYAFDTNVDPVARNWSEALKASEEHSGTDLAAALTQLAQDSAASPLAAAVVLTDGGHNAEADPVKIAASLSGLPVYIVPIGQTKALRDVLMHHVQAPRGVFKNDSILIDGMIDAHGCNGEEMTIELLQGEISVEIQRVPVTSDTFSHAFSFRRQAEQVGPQHFTVRALPLPNERVQDNNREQLTVEVTEDKVRLLLADHLPRWEHRYLRNLFKRDTRVQMDELLFEPVRNTGAPAAGNRWPADLDEWSRYRVVILGDVGTAELDTAQLVLLERYVRERGGTLILIAGEESMPAALTNSALEQMLPVQASDLPSSSTAGFSLFLTAEGTNATALQVTDDPVASERVWRQQVTLHRLSAYARPKQTAHVWLGAAPLDATQPSGRPDQAFLSWQDYGSGRVVYFAAPMTYRLRFRQGDTYHHRFWGQLLRWAIARDVSAGSLTVHLMTDKTRYKPSDSVLVGARLSRLDGDAVAGAHISVVAEQDRRTLARVELKEESSNPGRYFGTLRGLPPGSIRLRAEGSDVDDLLKSESRAEPVEAVAVIDPPDDPEMRNTQCNLPLLHQIAAATGGQLLPPSAVAALMSQIDLAPEVSEEVSERPLWARWSYLWIFMGCLTAEWVIRKLAGMA